MEFAVLKQSGRDRLTPSDFSSASAQQTRKQNNKPPEERKGKNKLWAGIPCCFHVRVVVFCKLRLHFLFFSVSFLLFMLMLMLMLLSSKLLSHTLHWHGIALPRRRRRAQRIHSRRRDTWVGSLLTSPTDTYIHNHLLVGKYNTLF